jgi:hypothetical protein
VGGAELSGLIVIESTVVAFAGRRLRDYRPGHLARFADVLIRDGDELLESDEVVYSATALRALHLARARGARLAVYTPQHEGPARRFFMYQGVPLVQESWASLVERNPGAAYLTTVHSKRRSPADIQPRFISMLQLSLTPVRVAEALDLLNIRRPLP